MTPKEIGDMIKIRREARGMTQAQLAKAIGVSESAIAMYEAGKRVPKPSTEEALADIFNVPIWAIRYSEDEVMPKPDPDDPDADIWQLREELRRDPNRRALLKLARNGTAQEVKQVAALIDALRATNPDFYDGDDPA